jgi:hypothetical protein
MNIHPELVPDPIDEALRRQLVVDDVVARDRSQRATADVLFSEIERGARGRRRRSATASRRRPILAVAGVLAASLLVAGALVPFGGGERGGLGQGAPFVAADATASEVLEEAARRMIAEDGGAAGSGDAWHSVSRSSYGTLIETWFDATTGTARFAWSEPARDDGAATYYVLAARVDGTSSIRQYEQVDGAWRPQMMSAQMETLVDPQSGVPLAPPSTESSAIRWLQAVGESDDPEQLRAATEQFQRDTRHMLARPVDPSADTDSHHAANMVLYLMRVARLEPTAVGQLYRDVADLDSLTRLDDGTVDGRPVMRVQLYPGTVVPELDMMESVLLLDEQTGAPVGIENEDGTRRTLFDEPVRVAAVGVDPVSCGAGPQPPCELLEGRGPIVAAADELAARAQARFARLHAQNSIMPPGETLLGSDDVRLELRAESRPPAVQAES